MEAQCEAAWGAGFRTLLPLLWCRDVGGRYHSVRCRFMDIISRLIRDNYNGQMHRWCQERGIQYIGHVLEDENSHARLGCGPTHFFRMEKHQDMGGVDLIGNQVMPYKDFPQAWYGNIDGDGEFYHYGLAKLASSEAHISPNKHGRSFCEVFAVYGPLAGTRLRKFLLDYLFVNGINMLIPADPRVPNVDIRFSLRESSYANRMCELLQSTTQIIRTAVLYHAEAEWYQADYQLFQKPAAQLARHQISYDIIPADVFEDTAFYHTDWSDGLIINGNRYDALIIPGADALPQAVAAFLPQAEKSGFPVIFCDWKPSVIAETGAPLPAPYGRCVPLAQLPAALEPVLRRDIRIFVLKNPPPGSVIFMRRMARTNTTCSITRAAPVRFMSRFPALARPAALTWIIRPARLSVWRRSRRAAVLRSHWQSSKWCCSALARQLPVRRFRRTGRLFPLRVRGM